MILHTNIYMIPSKRYQDLPVVAPSADLLVVVIGAVALELVDAVAPTGVSVLVEFHLVFRDTWQYTI